MTETAQLRSDLTWRELEDSVIVLDLRSSTYREINSSGSVLWKRLADGPATRETLVAALRAEFDVDDERAGSDVDEFLALLRQSGLLA